MTSPDDRSLDEIMGRVKYIGPEPPPEGEIMDAAAKAVRRVRDEQAKMPKMHVHGDKLTVTLPAAIRDEVAAHSGEVVDVHIEGSRIVIIPKGR